MLIVLLRYSVAQSGALKQLKPGAGLFVVQTRLMSNGLDHEQRKYAPLPRICGCWTWSLVLAPRIFYCVFIGSSQSHEHPNPKMCTPHRDLAILWVLDLIPCARAMHFPVIHNDFAQNQNNQPQKHMFFIGICERWSWSVCSRHIFSIMFSKRFEQCRTSRLQNINFSHGFVSAGLYPLCSRYAITHWRTTNIRKHMCKWILDRGTWPICSRIAFSIVTWAYSTKSMRFQVCSDP